MNMNYTIGEFPIEDLYVNPDNARFINADDLPDELSAIKEMVSIKSDHVVNLAKDIAADGLNPNELPILVYNSDLDCFLVMDGNRRITSIKLMTQYADKLDEMNFNASQNRKLKSLKFDLKTIRCMLCEDEEYANYLIEKLHTSQSGVSQVLWDPQAQDRHKNKSGLTSRRLAIIKMLAYSSFTSPEAKNILGEKGWLSKLQRFVGNKYICEFGIEFDKDNNILLKLEESEVMKGLSQLAIDLKNTVADKIAQTEEVRQGYLDNFPIDQKPNSEKINNPLVMFDVDKEQFVVTDIPNGTLIIDEPTNTNNPPSPNEAEKDDEQKDKIPNDSNPSISGNKPPTSDQEQDNTEEKPKAEDENEEKPVAKNPPISIPKFFEDLTWSAVDVNNSDNLGLLSVANEIVYISKFNSYKRLSISATFLTRALLEQTLIYHLKNYSTDKYNALLRSNNNKTPALEKLISYFVRDSSNIFRDNKNLERTFLAFADSTGTKHYLDMVIHNPHLVGANPDILDNIATAGLKSYIKAILNNQM